MKTILTHIDENNQTSIIWKNDAESIYEYRDLFMRFLLSIGFSEHSVSEIMPDCDMCNFVEGGD